MGIESCVQQCTSDTAPDGTVVYPKNADDSDGRWRWGETTVNKRKDILEFVKGSKGLECLFQNVF